MINVELATRAVNTDSKEKLKRYMPDDIHDSALLDFHCECSDEECRSRVSITLEAYEELHDSPAKFVITKGHQEPAVEKVLKVIGGISVVEKYALKDQKIDPKIAS